MNGRQSDRRGVVLVMALVIALTSGYLLVGRRSARQRPALPVVVASGSWAPFVGGALPDDGPLARVVVEVLRRQGMEPRLEFGSWSLAMERTSRSEVLGTFPFISGGERGQAFHLSDPIASFEYVLFYCRRHRPEAPTIDAGTLADLRIGRVEGYEVWTELDDAVDAFEEYRTSEDAFTALARGDIDLLPEGLLPGRAVIEDPTMPFDHRDFAVVPVAGDPLLGAVETLHFLMPRTPEGRRLIKQFNASLAQVRSGELYRDAMAQLRTPERDEVELVSMNGELVTVQDPTTGSSSKVPHGTIGVVSRWASNITDAVGAHEALVEVKLANGPGRGRLVLVDPRNVRLRVAL